MSKVFRMEVKLEYSGKKDLAKFCAFHDINGHDTAYCIHLEDHIEDLISDGYLEEFVAQSAKKYKDILGPAVYEPS